MWAGFGSKLYGEKHFYLEFSEMEKGEHTKVVRDNSFFFVSQFFRVFYYKMYFP